MLTLTRIGAHKKGKSEASSTYHALSMTYEVTRKGETALIRNTVDDLLDFQSAIVLAEAR